MFGGSTPTDSVLGVAALIFLAETGVVTLDTVRIIFVSRGYRLLSALMGLVVVSIWLFAIGQTMKNLESPLCLAAYAMGYTLGIWLGISIEEKLAIGAQMVRIITNKDAGPLIQKLRQAGHGVTSIPAHGASGRVHLLFTIVQRKQTQAVIDLVRGFDPQTFHTVEDVRKQEAGIFPSRGRGAGQSVGPSAAQTLGAPTDAVLSLLPSPDAGKAA